MRPEQVNNCENAVLDQDRTVESVNSSSTSRRVSIHRYSRVRTKLYCCEEHVLPERSPAALSTDVDLTDFDVKNF